MLKTLISYFVSSTFSASLIVVSFTAKISFNPTSVSPRFIINVYFSFLPVSLFFIWILYAFVSAFTSTSFSIVAFSSVKPARVIVFSVSFAVIFTVALLMSVPTYAVYTLLISFIVFPSTCNSCILKFNFSPRFFK